jgi:homoserine kinase type II
MAQFRTLSADDVREILAALAARPVYLSHQPIAAGTINTNVRLETESGPLFLRINEGKTLDDVRREAAIVAHASARGVPTPAPLLTGAGDPCVAWRGELASVFPWIPGRTLVRAEVTPRAAALVGTALAGLHAASDGFADHRPGRYELEEIRRRFDGFAALARPELEEAVALLGPELDAIARANPPAVSRGIIHGDLFIDNVLFSVARSDVSLTALLDFEQACWGRLAYDLAVTTLAFGFGRDDFRTDVVRALLDAYAAARPPTEAERATFPGELRFVACRFAVTRVTDVHFRRAEGAPAGKDFRRYLARLTSVREHLARRDGLFDL